MLTDTANKRSREEPEASSSIPSGSRQDYAFSFQLLDDTSVTKALTDMDLVPPVLLGKLVEQREALTEGSVQWSKRSRTPAWLGPAAARSTLTVGATEIESQIKVDAKDRHYPALYTMRTGAAADRSVKEVMASSQVRQAFQQLNESISKGQKESDLAENIKNLDTSVRHALGLEGSDYGGLMRIEKYPMKSAEGQRPADREIDRPDLVVPRSRSGVKIKAASKGSLKDVIECYWSNALSFIEVKADASHDLKDATVLQCLRYARKICQYQAPTSHVHFVSWCGNVVRLWYQNASLYGCSRPFNTGNAEDQEAIINILRFVNLRQCSTQLCGRLDVATLKHLDLDPDTVTRGGDTRIEFNSLEELDVRPGPFRTRTAVYADQGKAVTRRLVKISWQPRHLESHELEVLRKIQQYNEDSEDEFYFPNAPIAIGLGIIEAPDFQPRNSDVLPAVGPEPKFQSRIIVVLITEQCLGDEIGDQVTPEDLVHIHLELAGLFLMLATKGLHYRDINEGNIRTLRGEHRTILVIDFGNVRENLSPWGRSGLTDAEAILDRARDDTKSANALFLPSCCAHVQAAIVAWDDAATRAAREFKQALGDNHSDHRSDLRPGLLRISARLSDLRSALRDQVTYSHRYIDDLESAVYLHFWRTACNLDSRGTNLPALTKLLDTFADKMALWEGENKWTNALSKYCDGASLIWTDLICGLRSTILDARKDLGKALSHKFEAQFDLEVLKEELLTRPWSGDMAAKSIINQVFENKGLLQETGLQQIERDCFEECIRLLREAETKMEAQATSQARLGRPEAPA